MWPFKRSIQSGKNLIERPIVVLDSWGSRLPCEKYRDVLSHITFKGFDSLFIEDQGSYHGHGSWCAWDIASQFLSKDNIVFIQIFDNTGAGSISPQADKWWQDTIRDVKPSQINCSWGGYSANDLGLDSYYNEAWVATFLQLLEDIDADVFFAAGNDGNFAESYPQKKLVGRSDRVHIIGACNVEGVPSSFSSSAERNDKRYVDVTYLGEGSASLDATTGQIIVWNGTSSACPHALGDARAKNLCGKALKDYWREYVLTDFGGDGVPDGVASQFADTIKSGLWLPKVGVGVAEGSRQENMIKTKLGLMVGDVRRGLNVAPMYHDFRKL